VEVIAAPVRDATELESVVAAQAREPNGQQKRYIDPPNPADASLQYEDCMVPWASHPRVYRGTGPALNDLVGGQVDYM
jgi:hypothetical protein